MSKRIAVIDLGTNTFHLLIGEKADGQINHIFRRTEPVKLGEGGINDGLIRPVPFKRGLDCMSSFAKNIADHAVTEVHAIATSAIRSAKNGREFIDKVKAQAGISIEMIDGLQEAKFIYQGIRASGCLSDENSLVMDIGGGSVEFIIGNADGIKWKHSFEIGAARMMGLFHQIDPLPVIELDKLHSWLDEKLQRLFEAVKGMPVHHLIGSAGAFETFAEMIEAQKGNELDINSIKTYQFEMRDFFQVADTLRKSSHAERLHMKGIIPLRIDMIVTASVLTKFVIERLRIEKLSMSTFSLKEGALAEMLDVN